MKLADISLESTWAQILDVGMHEDRLQPPDIFCVAPTKKTVLWALPGRYTLLIPNLLETHGDSQWQAPRAL